MIITKLKGGLGNQMFQYAIGKFLAEKNNISFKLDISWFDNLKKGTTPRKYSLKTFNISENFATKKEIKKLKKYEWRSGKRNFFHNLFFANKLIYLQEKQFNFNKNISKTSDNIYLEGYWQSEKYFKEIRDIIQKEFTLKNNLESVDSDLKQKIKNSNSISLHIRRTDYITEKKGVYESCSLEYYQEAIQKISKQFNDLHIFIFSDDIEWSKNNLKTNFPITFINGNKDYEDLILMSLCKHNIIANSSFSWWGAWLNQNPDKIIVAPKKWSKDKKRNVNDLIPKSWIKI